MSWNGTVQCGACWEKGHNKRSCPKRKERIERLREQDPDDYRVRSYDEEQAKGKKRSCKYCSVVGHNTKTCAKKKQDLKVVNIANKHYRTKWIDELLEAGIVPGTLINCGTVTDRNYNRHENCPGIVTDIQWRAVHVKEYLQHHNVQLSALISGAGTPRSQQFRIPKFRNLHGGGGNIEIIGAVPGSIGFFAPKGWATEDVTKDDWFDNKWDAHHVVATAKRFLEENVWTNTEKVYADGYENYCYQGYDYPKSHAAWDALHADNLV